MKILKKGVIALIISSCITLSDTRIDLAVTKKDELIKKEPIKQTTEIVCRNSQLYDGYIEGLKEKILNKADNHSNTVNSKIIDLAFKYANDKQPLDESSIEDYFTMVAMHLAIMEVESNFDNSVICNNPTTKDYGIMQINTMVIPNARKELHDSSLDPYDLEDNISMGSWEVYECYKKALRKHPDNLLWYTYAYYNRGLYFEKYNYDFDEANERSQKFIKSFYRYFSILYNS